MSRHENELNAQWETEAESGKDEELIGVLMAISVVAKQLAKKLIKLKCQEQVEKMKKIKGEKGVKRNEPNERTGHDHKGNAAYGKQPERNCRYAVQDVQWECRDGRYLGSNGK